MRFLLDQDVYAVTARFLADAGHDVVLVAEIGLSQASDEEILRVAQEQSRVLVTRDRDYGNLVFCESNWNWCDLSENLAYHCECSS
jgi:predicted nuclease of predicted toxin-antitoxin system